MSHSTLRRVFSRRGASLVDVLVAATIFGAGAVGIAYTVSQTSTTFTESNQVTQEAAVDSARQAAIVQGFDPTATNVMSDVEVDGTGTSTSPTLTTTEQAVDSRDGTVSVLMITSDSLNGGNRAPLAGQVIDVKSDAPPAIITLDPTTPNLVFYNRNGIVKSPPFSMSDYPIRISMNASTVVGNPAGTVYRYTTDGSAPTSGSSVWPGDLVYSLTAFPANVAIAAFNPETGAPSAIVSSSLTCYLDGYQVVGQGSGNGGLGFSFADFVSNQDHVSITLHPSVVSTPPSVTVNYGFAVGGPAAIGGGSPVIAVGAPITLPAPNSGSWDTGVGPTVSYQVTSTDTRYASVGVQSVPTLPISVPLATPIFVTSPVSPVLVGASVTSDANGAESYMWSAIPAVQLGIVQQYRYGAQAGEFPAYAYASVAPGSATQSIEVRAQ